MDEYIKNQLKIISKLFSDTIKNSSTTDFKLIIEHFEILINNIKKDENISLSNILVDNIKNVIKLLTTQQLKFFLQKIEETPVENIEKVIFEILQLIYRVMENSYNGFLNFVINKNEQKNSTNLDKKNEK